MKQKARTWIAVLCLTVAGSGCATASRGTNQSIQVGSNPEGAECVFTREGETLGKVTTPGPITVKRDRRPINVVCTKDGHEDARAVLNSLTDTAAPQLTLPVIGGLMAVSNLVDMASGADTRYQTALTVKLEPLSTADQTAAVQPAASAKTAAPPQTAVATPAPDASQVPAAAAAPFLTGPWKAHNVLIADRSAGSCAREGGAYSLDLTGDTLTVDNINGRMLSATIPPDGKIDQSFRSPSGARLAIVGNARSRDLEIVNSASACRWKLTPI